MVEIDNIEFLVARKFTAHGPVMKAKPLLDEDIGEYRNYLLNLPKENLLALAKDERELERHEREPFACPFYWSINNLWGRLACWTVDEAIALSLDYDPTTMNWSVMEPMIGFQELADRYSVRRDMALRAVAIGALSDPMPPAAFVVWADRNKISFSDRVRADVIENIPNWGPSPNSFSNGNLPVDHAGSAVSVSELRARNNQLETRLAEEIAKSRSATSLGKRERSSLYKLIFGMAVRGYRWDPSAKKSDKVADIVGDCELEGLALDGDTVRKWLREAAHSLGRAGARSGSLDE